MKLYIVRHAKSKRNAGSTDDNDSVLTEDGKEQSRRLGRYFHNKSIDVVFCSKLKRAKQTLKEMLPALGKVKVIYTDEITEHEMGIYGDNGKDDWSGYAKAWKVSGIKEFLDFKPEKGDSMNETYVRAKKFYNTLLKKYNGKNVLIVGHGIFNLYLILNALNLPAKEGAYYQLSNASVSSLSIDKKGKVNDFHINDYHHLIIGGMNK